MSRGRTAPRRSGHPQSCPCTSHCHLRLERGAISNQSTSKHACCQLMNIHRQCHFRERFHMPSTMARSSPKTTTPTLSVSLARPHVFSSKRCMLCLTDAGNSMSRLDFLSAQVTPAILNSQSPRSNQKHVKIFTLMLFEGLDVEDLGYVSSLLFRWLQLI